MTLDRGPVVFTDYIEANARHLSRRTVVVSGERSLSWREFNEITNRLANHFISLGLLPGNRLGLVVNPDAAFVEVSIAALKARLCVVPMSPLSTTETLVRLAKDANIKVLAVSPAYTAQGTEIKNQLGLSVSHCLVMQGSSEGFSEFDEVMRSASAADLTEAPMPQDEFNIIYSSGTTGTPKGVVHTHYTRLMNMLSYAHRYGIRHDSVVILSTTSSTNGSWVNMLPTLMTGGKLILMPKFDAEKMLDIMERDGVTHAFLVPTQIKGIFESPSFSLRDFSKFKVLIAGGSKFPSALKRLAMERWPGRLHELYGMTEGSGTTLYPSDLPEKIDSVGRPIAGTEFRVIGEDGVELPQGEVGELVMRGVAIMKGYLNRPEADAELVWRDPRGRLFIRTGDVGRVDDEGYVYIMDRQRDMIISGGINVFASDLEDVIRLCPGVQDAAVIAALHEKWGETPLAIVVLEPGATTTAEEVLKFSNDKLGKFQRLNSVILRNSLFPRNDLGKLMKRMLRDEYLAGQKL